MITEAKFKYTLKEMMLTMPLEEINVTALCEKCGCHRQTFYYHFQNIYDLLAAYFLNEKVTGLTESDSIIKALESLIDYSKTNFSFLRSSYNSAAHDLVDDFFYNKMVNKIFLILSKNEEGNLSTNAYRILARRFSRLVSDEFGYQFKDTSITPIKFEKRMKRFVKLSLSTIYPALLKLGKEESKK